MKLTDQQERQVRMLEVRHRGFAEVYAYGANALVVVPGPPAARVRIAGTYIVQPNGAVRQPREVER